MTPDSTESATRPLDYATLDADGNPEWVPEAEAAIDRGEKPNAIARHFANSRLARSYMAKSLRRRFSFERRAPDCVCCSTKTTSFVKLRCQFQAPRAWFDPRPSDADFTAQFEACQTICSECALRWFRKLKWPRRVLLAARTLKWVILSIFALQALLWKYYPITRTANVIIVSSFYAAWLILFGFAALRMRRIFPATIRRRFPKWCKAGSIVEYCDGRQQHGRPLGSAIRGEQHG